MKRLNKQKRKLLFWNHHHLISFNQQINKQNKFKPQFSFGISTRFFGILIIIKICSLLKNVKHENMFTVNYFDCQKHIKQKIKHWIIVCKQITRVIKICCTFCCSYDTISLKNEDLLHIFTFLKLIALSANVIYH